MKKTVVGILAHVDSGKTTLSEAMLYRRGEIKKLGRVDHGDSFLDTDTLERNRGITIFSKQAIMDLEHVSVTLLDTPGHVDFSAEMERSLQVMDYAVLVISGSEGVQSHTETLWKLLKRHEIPTFIFVNKMDLSIKKQSEVMAEIQTKLHKSCVDFTNDFKSEELQESLAVCDEKLLEKLLEGGAISQAEAETLIVERKIFPCYFGSALKLIGVDELIDGLNTYIKAMNYPMEFGGRVYKISRDSQNNRLTYIKVTGGSLYVRDSLKGKDQEGNPFEEKITQVRLYSGMGYQCVDGVGSGTICAVTGLSHTYPGQGLGIEKDEENPILEPVLTYRINLPEVVDSHTGLAKLKLIEEEDPKLHVVWNKEIDEIHIQLMGPIQMEVLRSIIKERYNMDVSFGQGKILYKETIKEPVYGVGHFEPLRHYAEVHLLIEPGEAGSGVVFDSDVREDELDKNWQRLILTHLQEKPHLGVLTGSPITDIKITLKSGKAHKKHTEGGDFRQATYRAVRQGLMQAESLLLEPWYDFLIELPTENIGRAMSDIQKMGGITEPPETFQDKSRLVGKAPVSRISDYSMELNNYSKGAGSISCILAGYRQCANQEEVVNSIGYEPEHDVVNSADSVFCQNGAGVNIKWNEVFEYMDLPSAMEREKIEDDEELRAKARAYGSKMVSDKELMAIFERTYGPVKKDPRIGTRIVKSKKKEEVITYVRPQKKKSDIEYLLIDGYNVIHDWDELRELMNVDFGAARDKLIDIMCNYQGFMQINVIIVFDAYKVKGGKRNVEKVGNVNVVYTKEAETADMYIEKVTHDIARNHPVRVVTSDGLEQLIITGHGAGKVSSSAFKEEVENVNNAIREFLNN